MTQPSSPASQVRHPWRATLRTAVAGTIGALSLLPTIAAVGHLDAAPGVTQALAVSAGVTRVLAIPAVEVWLHRFAPWLAAQPPEAS